MKNKYNEDDGGDGGGGDDGGFIPGFGVIAVVGAIGISFVLFRRKLDDGS